MRFTTTYFGSLQMFFGDTLRRRALQQHTGIVQQTPAPPRFTISTRFAGWGFADGALELNLQWFKRFAGWR
jgi:hypothetical protein